MKIYRTPVFRSKELINEKAAIENPSLKNRLELLEQVQMEKNLKGRDGRLYNRDKNQWNLIPMKVETETD